MIFQQVHKATFKLYYAGLRYLVNPVFTPSKGGELAVRVSDLLDVDFVIVTQLTPEFCDQAALNAIPKNMPFFVVSAGVKDALSSMGFSKVELVPETGIMVDTSTFSARKGQSLSGYTESYMAIQLDHPSEKSLYILGDVALTPEILKSVKELTHSAVLAYPASYEEVKKLFEANPKDTFICNNLKGMEAADLTNQIAADGHSDLIFAPADGETYYM